MADLILLLLNKYYYYLVMACIKIITRYFPLSCFHVLGTFIICFMLAFNGLYCTLHIYMFFKINQHHL